MSKQMTSKAVMVVTILAIVGFGTYAFADWGMGYDRHGWEHRGPGWHHGPGWRHGPGWHHGGGGEPGYGYMRENLNDDDIAALEKEREAFFNATKNLRQDIYAKRLALRSELAKKDPDVEKAKDLQKEISDLKAKIGQERVDHMIKMKKINPNAGRGYGSGRGRSQGGGYCWR